MENFYSWQHYHCGQHGGKVQKLPVSPANKYQTILHISLLHHYAPYYTQDILVNI
jgi:hypothetical protein